MQIRISVLLILFSSVFAHAQPDTLTGLDRITYFNYLNSGALFAKKNEGIGFSVSTIHGVRYRKIFGALGIGYDAADEWRLIPCMASIGLNLVEKRSHALFVQCQGGYALARNVPLQNNFQPAGYKADGGTTLGSMLGYRIKKENLSLYFMAGYKFQRLEYETDSWWWNPTATTTVKREIQRISVQIGFGLN